MMTHDQTKQPIYHKDGTITYWDTYRERWVKRADYIPNRHLVAFAQQEYLRAKAHFSRYGQAE